MNIELRAVSKRTFVEALADIVETMRTAKRRNIHHAWVFCDDLYQLSRSDDRLFPGSTERQLAKLMALDAFVVSLVPPGGAGGDYQAILISVVECGHTTLVDVTTLGDSINARLRYRELCARLQQWDSDRQKRAGRRERNHRQRIIAGLIRWRNETAGDSIDTLTRGQLMSKTTYYEYRRLGLAYTVDGVGLIGATFADLWAAFTTGVLESAIDSILLKME